ncbi:hypothetical protein OBBRIDRAFT_633548 [Obba rivulosa]|uniref:Uncharacterized protein n=1 Tax=Obba rivulosa TaxID=1052685 RepID=A0A8E2AS90_9APHY|nr:hypothetical protein OBBRIDRAFT_633548 [Obba rivulosa]
MDWITASSKRRGKTSRLNPSLTRCTSPANRVIMKITFESRLTKTPCTCDFYSAPTTPTTLTALRPTAMTSASCTTSKAQTQSRSAMDAVCRSETPYHFVCTREWIHRWIHSVVPSPAPVALAVSTPETSGTFRLEPVKPVR